MKIYSQQTAKLCQIPRRNYHNSIDFHLDKLDGSAYLINMVDRWLLGFAFKNEVKSQACLSAIPSLFEMQAKLQFREEKQFLMMH